MPADLGLRALGGDVLVELVLGARRDDDLPGVLHHLGDAPVGVHHDGPQPVQLPVGHVGRIDGRSGAGIGSLACAPRVERLGGTDTQAAREDDLRRDDVLLVVVGLGVAAAGASAQRQLGAVAGLARLELSRAT